VVEPGVSGVHPSTEWRQAESGGIECSAISVETENFEMCPLPQERFGVAAGAERAIEHHPGRNAAEELSDLGDHHGIVMEGGLRRHVRPSPIGS
jgi:hypothetical protein